MKKIVLSLCLLGVTAPQSSQAIAFVPDCITNTITSPTTQRITLTALVGYYFFILKKRKPVDVEGAEWSWRNLITKFGEDGYVSKELIGNFKDCAEMATFSVAELTDVLNAVPGATVDIVKDKKTLTKAYGLLGTLDAMIISKLKEFAELLKAIKDTKEFVKDPVSYFTS